MCNATATRYLGVLFSYNPAGFGSAVVLNGNPTEPAEQIFVHFAEIVEESSPVHSNTLKLGDSLSFEIDQARQGKLRRAANVRIIRRAATRDGGFTMCPCCDRILPDSAGNGYGISRRVGRQERQLESGQGSNREDLLQQRYGADYVPPEQRYAAIERKKSAKNSTISTVLVSH